MLEMLYMYIVQYDSHVDMEHLESALYNRESNF